MTKYRVTGPDGTKYDVDAPDGSSDDDIIKHVQQQHGTDSPPAAKPGWASRIAGAALGALPGGQLAGRMLSSETGQNLVKGGLQGAILDPAEGIGQLIEHMTGTKLAPDFIRDKLKSFRSGVESTTAGEAGRIGGAVGSMFIPVGGEVSAGARAAEAARAGRTGLNAVRTALGQETAETAGLSAVRSALGQTTAGEAGLTGVRGALGPQRAGPAGYAAVRRAVANPAEASKPMWTRPEDYLGYPRVRPSTAAATRRDVVPPPELPVGPMRQPPPSRPVTMGERARLAADDMTHAGRQFVQRWPGAAGTLGGLARAAAQPVEGPNAGEGYWTAKGAQAALGALPPAVAATPAGRAAAAWLASHGAVAVPAAAAGMAGAAAGVPHELLYGAGVAAPWALHRAMRRAHHKIAPRVEGALEWLRRHPRASTAGGAVTGQGVGRLGQEDDEESD